MRDSNLSLSPLSSARKRFAQLDKLLARLRQAEVLFYYIVDCGKVAPRLVPFHIGPPGQHRI